MRILVISDSHGSYRDWIKVIEKERKTGFQAFIFLGDGEDDYMIAMRNVVGTDTYRIRGNNDYNRSIPYTSVVDIGQHRFFLCHGHTFDVDHGLERLENAAAQNGCHAALFGHTHCRHYSFSNGIHLFNPGSISLPRGGEPHSYGIITDENGKLDFFHYDV